MTAFADMMRKQIVMPAHLMDDLEHQGRTGRSLFKDFSSVAQMTGTYTSHVRAPDSGLPCMLHTCCLCVQVSAVGTEICLKRAAPWSHRGAAPWSQAMELHVGSNLTCCM